MGGHKNWTHVNRERFKRDGSTGHFYFTLKTCKYKCCTLVSFSHHFINVCIKRIGLYWSQHCTRRSTTPVAFISLLLWMLYSWLILLWPTCKTEHLYAAIFNCHFTDHKCSLPLSRPRPSVQELKLYTLRSYSVWQQEKLAITSDNVNTPRVVSSQLNSVLFTRLGLPWNDIWLRRSARYQLLARQLSLASDYCFSWRQNVSCVIFINWFCGWRVST